MLVIEVDGVRRRFPAMPEPPSLAGGGPGIWRLSFAVPGELAPDPGARAWLQFGTVVVPLPRAVQVPGTRDVADQRSSPPELTLVTKRSGASRRQPTRRRASQTWSGISPAPAPGARSCWRHSPTAIGPGCSPNSGPTPRRPCGAIWHESSLRPSAGPSAPGRLSATWPPPRTVSGRSRTSCGSPGAAATKPSRSPPPRRRVGGGAPPRTRTATADRPRLRMEQELTRRRAGTATRVAAEPALPRRRPPPPPPEPPPPPHASAVEPPLPSPEPDLQTSPALREAAGADAPGGDLVRALRRELGVRAAEDASLRARLVDAETRLAARVLLEHRTTVVLGQLRQELDGLRAAVERERALRAAAERRADELQAQLSAERSLSRRAYDAISDLRDVLDRLSRPITPAGASPAAGTPTETAAESDVGVPPPAESGSEVEQSALSAESNSESAESAPAAEAALQAGESTASIEPSPAAAESATSAEPSPAAAESATSAESTLPPANPGDAALDPEANSDPDNLKLELSLRLSFRSSLSLSLRLGPSPPVTGGPMPRGRSRSPHGSTTRSRGSVRRFRPRNRSTSRSPSRPPRSSICPCARRFGDRRWTACSVGL